MTDVVNATPGATVSSPLTETYGRPTTDVSASELDKDTFLKLLVAQMKYQDPLEPSSSEDFIATTAQFTTVEKLDELAKQGANTAMINSLTSASALIGRNVTVTRNGETFETVVERSQITSGQVFLVTAAGPVRFSEVTGVGPQATDGPISTPAPAAPAPAAPAPTVEPEPVPEPVAETEPVTETEPTPLAETETETAPVVEPEPNTPVPAGQQPIPQEEPTQ